MGWTKSVVTSNGVELLNESLAGHTLTITSAAAGAGVLQTPEELMQAATVTDKRQNLKLLGIEDCDGGKKVKIQITNQGVTEKYYLHQVGVYAKLNYQDTESLLFIMQDDRGVEIPTPEENADFLFEMYAIIAISNDANIRVNMSNSAVVTVGLLTEGLRAVGGIKMDLPIAIGPEAWKQDPSGENGYAYFCDIEEENITEEMVPMVTIYESSISSAVKYGISPVAETYQGYVRMKSERKPESRIQGICNLFTKGDTIHIFTDESGGTGGGDSSVATDADVDKILKEVFGAGSSGGENEDEDSSDEIATDEEVADLVNGIFGN